MIISPSDVVAIVAIAATVAVAWIGHRDRADDRDHAVRLAREARIQERRIPAYRDMLAVVLRIEDVVRQTMPMWERIPPPPRIEPPSTDELRDVAVALGIYGTTIVRERLDATSKAADDFFRAAEYLNDIRTNPAPSQGAGDDIQQARQAVDANREAFFQRRKELEAAARDDVALEG